MIIQWKPITLQNTLQNNSIFIYFDNVRLYLKDGLCLEKKRDWKNGKAYIIIETIEYIESNIK